MAEDETNNNTDRRDNENLRSSERDRSTSQGSEPVKNTSEEVLGSVESWEYTDANASAVDDNFISVTKRTSNHGLEEIEDGSSRSVVPTTESAHSAQREAELLSDDKAIDGTKKNESGKIEKLEIVHNDDINESNSSQDLTELPETASVQAEWNGVRLSVTNDNESLESVSRPIGNTSKLTKTMVVVHQADINETNNSFSAPVSESADGSQKETESQSKDELIDSANGNKSGEHIKSPTRKAGNIITIVAIVHQEMTSKSGNGEESYMLPNNPVNRNEVSKVEYDGTKKRNFTTETDNGKLVSSKVQLAKKHEAKPTSDFGDKQTDDRLEKHTSNISDRRTSDENEPVSATVSESADALQKETEAQSKDGLIDSTNGNEGGEHIKSPIRKAGNIVTTVAIVHREMKSKSGNGEESCMLSSNPVNRNEASKVVYDGTKKRISTTETDNGKLVSSEIHLTKKHEAEPTSDFGDKQADDRLEKHTSNISDGRTSDENEQLSTFERSEEEHIQQKRDAENDVDNCTEQKFAFDNVDEKVNLAQEESIACPTTQQNSDIDENWMSVVIKQEPLSDVDDEEFNRAHEETTELQDVLQQKVAESPMKKPTTKKGNIETKQKKKRGKTKSKTSEDAGETTKMGIAKDNANENYKRSDVVVKKEVIDTEEDNGMIRPGKTAGHQNDVNKAIVAEVESDYPTKCMLTRSTDSPLHATARQKGQKGSNGKTKEKKSKARKKLENISDEIQMKTRAGKGDSIRNKLTDQLQDSKIVDRNDGNIQTITRKNLGQVTKERKQKKNGLKTRKTLPEKGLIKEEPVCEAELNEGQCLGNQVKKTDIIKKRRPKITSPPSDRILRSAESDRKYHCVVKTEDPLPMYQTEPPNLEIGTIILKRNHEKEKLSTTGKRPKKDFKSNSRNVIPTSEMKTGKKGAKRNKNSNHGMKTVIKKVKQVTRMNQPRNFTLVNQSVARTTFTEKQSGPKKNTENRNIKKLMNDKPENAGTRKSEGKLEGKSAQENQQTPSRITRQQNETRNTKEWNEKSTTQEHQSGSTRITRHQNENSTNQEHQLRPTRVIRQQNENKTSQEHQPESTRVTRQQKENSTNQKHQLRPTRFTRQQNENRTSQEHQSRPTRATRQRNENSSEHQSRPTQNTRQQNEDRTSQEPQSESTQITRQQNENSTIQKHQPRPMRTTRQQNESRSSARKSKSDSDGRRCTRSQTVTGQNKTDNVAEQGKSTFRKEEERIKGTSEQVKRTSVNTGNKKQAVASRPVITRESNTRCAVKDEELNDYQNEPNNLVGQKSEDKHVHKQDVAKVNVQSCSDTYYIYDVEIEFVFCSNLRKQLHDIQYN